MEPWEQMVSAIDVAKRALVALLKTLAGIYVLSCLRADRAGEASGVSRGLSFSNIKGSWGRVCFWRTKPATLLVASFLTRKSAGDSLLDIFALRGGTWKCTPPVIRHWATQKGFGAVFDLVRRHPPTLLAAVFCQESPTVRGSKTASLHVRALPTAPVEKYRRSPFAER